MAFKTKSGSGSVPNDYEDQALVKWTKRQQEDYQKWKKGEKTYLDEDGFAMLTGFGFDWTYAKKETKAASTPSRTTSKKPPVTKKAAAKEDSPPASKKTLVMEKRAPKAKKEEDEPTTEMEGGDDSEKQPATEDERLIRRSSRRKMSNEVETPEQPQRKLRKIELPRRSNRAVQKPAPLPTPTAPMFSPPPKTQGYKHRVLTRIIPLSEEPAVIDRLKKEQADLLKCDEPLVANGSAGISSQRAEWNRFYEDRFLELLVFKECYGHVYVPKEFKENSALGRFVSKLRRWNRTGDVNLTESRRRRLDAIGFKWDAKSDDAFWNVQGHTKQAIDKFETHFQMLVDYVKENGDPYVPKEYPDNPALARWACRQRSQLLAKKRGLFNTLDDERERRLREIGFITDLPRAQRIPQHQIKRLEKIWNEYYVRLVAFFEKHGHSDIPRRWKQDQPLASWAMRQVRIWRFECPTFSSHSFAASAVETTDARRHRWQSL